MSRFAVIDVGSNSVKLLIAEQDSSGTFHRHTELVRLTRLGEGIHARRLREAAMRRTIDALAEFADICRQARAVGPAAVGTAALRESVNGDEFVERAATVGVPVERISGDEEARLSFLAVRLDPRWQHAPCITVIDIGGGSTEIVRGGAAITERRSLLLGAVRLTESELHSDPPTIHQISSASRTAGIVLEEASSQPDAGQAVGVGGTCTNLASIKLGGINNELEAVHGVRLTIEEVEVLTERLAAMAVSDRKRIPGLDPERADIILGGAIILGQTLHRLGLDACDVSARGLRWGLLYDRFGMQNYRESRAAECHPVTIHV